MACKKYLLLSVVFLKTCLFIYAIDDRIIVLEDGRDTTPIENYLYVSPVYAKGWSISDASAKDNQSLFVPLAERSVSAAERNYNGSWFRFELIDRSTQGDWILWDNVFSYGDRDQYECYTVRDGNVASIEDRVIVCNKKSYKLSFDKGETIVFYIHYKYDVFVLDTEVVNLKSFVRKNNYESLFYGIIFGIMALLAMYNLFIYFSIRDSNYIFYAAFVIVFGFFLLLSGFFSLYIDFRHYDRLYRNAQLLSIVSFLAFAKNFLQAKKYAITLNGILSVFVWVMLGSSVLFNIFFDYLSGILPSIVYLAAILIFIVVIVLETVVFVKGYFAAVFFISATILLIAVGTLYSLAGIAMLPDSFARDLLKLKALELSSIVMIFLFSFGLSYRIGLIRKDKEAAQRAAMENLEKTNKLKDEFISNTSHELRTPLHGISGLTESLLNGLAGRLPSRAIFYLRNIALSSKRLSLLVNDILDLVKMKHKELSVSLLPVDLSVAANHVIAFTVQLAGEKRISVENKIKKQLPFVLADENRLIQILFNLTGNAVKYTESGSITIDAREIGGSIEISVADTGIGIESENIPRIFGDFEQIDGSITRSNSGLGLGLSISKKLAEIMGGALRAESIPGKGSTFFLTLPRAREKTGTDYKGRETGGTTGPYLQPHGSFPVTVRGKARTNLEYRVLAVDDDPVNLQIIKDHLGSRRRIDVILSDSGRSALDTLEHREDIDMVLLDVMMPKISGFDVCREIRKKYSLYEKPVIMLTAKNRIEDLLASFDSGANDYIIKPFELIELEYRVMTLLKTKKLTEANTLLKETGELKSHLIKIAAHDLRTPLTLINLYTGRLKKETGDERSLELIGNIGNSSDRMVRLIDEMLENAQLNDGKIELQPEKIDMTQFLARLTGNFEELAEGKKQRIIFETNFHKPVFLYGDRGRLEEVFDNLVSNALKYSPPGSKTIVGLKKTGDRIIVTVKDQGPGLTDEDKQKIFVEYQKLSAQPTGNESSTGIGLSITKKLVDLHRGFIRAESVYGKGTTFIVGLPVKGA